MRTGGCGLLACLLRDACLTGPLRELLPRLQDLIVCTAAATASATPQLAARSLLGCSQRAADEKHAWNCRRPA
jgi:hypothetical protein